MSTKKVLAVAGALALGLSPTAALSHTNSIGYVGDGQGGITFWYGSWHGGTNFNEAEIKLEGVNGTSYGPTITQFTLLESSTPAGLIPGTNYFTSDGTQLVPYDTNIQTSYTWQGVTFTGLAAGDYTFTYIPLGDPQSYCTTCTPTMDWVPMDQVILSASVTLSSAVLSGDANGNGIPDIQEFGTVVTPPTPTAPTLVNTALSYLVTASVAAPTFTSNTVVTHTSTEKNGKQTLKLDSATTVTATTVTTTTTTPVTTHTYSDGSTHVMNGTPVITTSSSSRSAVSHRYADFSGRIDQLEVLDGIGDAIAGLLNHEPSRTKERFRVFENNRFVQSYNADGYSADSKIFGGGFEYDLTKGWTAGYQYHNANVNLSGDDSKSSQNKNVHGIFNTLHGNTLSLNTNAAIAFNDYSYRRTLEDVFNNSGETKGQEWWVSNRLYLHATNWLSPFVGHTVRNVKRDAYVESGDARSARSVEAVDSTSHVGEVGLKLETRFGGKKNDDIGVSVDGSYGTDNSYGVTASLDYKEVIHIEGSHGVSDGITNNSVAAKVKFRF